MAYIRSDQELLPYAHEAIPRGDSEQRVLKEGMFEDLNLANKQLRFVSRFLMVCLLLNRREMVRQLLNQLRVLVDECKRTFQIDEHVQREIMNHRSLKHPNIIRFKEMDEHVQREIMNHRSLKNPNIIRFKEVNPQFYAFKWITLLLTQEFNFIDSLHTWDALSSDLRVLSFSCSPLLKHVSSRMTMDCRYQTM